LGKAAFEPRINVSALQGGAGNRQNDVASFTAASFQEK
jgi:hypothetical protein